jgi:hypothetical protein
MEALTAEVKPAIKMSIVSPVRGDTKQLWEF